MHGILFSVTGSFFIYRFIMDRVSITGRKRVSWLSRSTLMELDEMDRRVIEEIRKNGEKFFVRSDHPGLRKVEAVFNGLVKASGLDDKT